MCSVAFEHAESVKVLIASGNFTSALGLVRLQYEALVRAMWLLYSASDIAVSRNIKGSASLIYKSPRCIL